jgi:hypothetical protein
MRRGRKFLIFYFVFFGIFSLIAVIPGGALFLALITAMVLPLFGAGGFLAIAAPTVLLYSAALVPLWLALTEPRRRIPLIAVTALLPIVVALVPGMLSRQEATEFAMRDGQRRHAPSSQNATQAHRTDWRSDVRHVRLRADGRRQGCFLQRNLPTPVVQWRGRMGPDDADAGS